MKDVKNQLQPLEGLKRTAGTLEDVLCCSAEKELESSLCNKGKIGIDALRWAILEACGMTKITN